MSPGAGLVSLRSPADMDRVSHHQSVVEEGGGRWFRRASVDRRRPATRVARSSPFDYAGTKQPGACSKAEPMNEERTPGTKTDASQRDARVRFQLPPRLFRLAIVGTVTIGVGLFVVASLSPIFLIIGAIGVAVIADGAGRRGCPTSRRRGCRSTASTGWIAVCSRTFGGLAAQPSDGATRQARVCE